jgi:hypothetical protein
MEKADKNELYNRGLRASAFTFKYRKTTGFEEFLTARSKESNKFLHQSLFFSLPSSTANRRFDSASRFIFFKIL